MRSSNLSPAVRDDLVFIRRWAAVFFPVWCLAGLAGWRSLDTYDSTMALLWPGLLVFLLPRVIGMRLDDRPRFRRTALVYIAGMVCYVTMHGVRAVLE